MKNDFCDENCFECKFRDCILPDRYLVGLSKKEVVIVNAKGEKFIFKSRVAASRYLHRGDTYIQNRLRIGKDTLNAKDGSVYRIKK